MATAGMLLRYMAWNKERLIEKYMDNSYAVSTAAGITEPELRTSVSPPIRSSASRRPTRATTKLAHPPKPATPKLPFVCPICFDDSGLPTRALSCGHQFCTVCWTTYVTSKIREESEHSIKCMAEGCGLVAPDAFIRKVLCEGDATEEDKATWIRFQELLVRHFVACNPNLKFCPYPSCTNTVSCPAAASKSSLTSIVPIVSCGARGLPGAEVDMEKSTSVLTVGKEHKFCFGCPIESDHRPVVCGVARMWLKKCRDDSETANWIKSNTKECSKCMSTIEKNGGCK